MGLCSSEVSVLQIGVMFWTPECLPLTSVLCCYFTFIFSVMWAIVLHCIVAVSFVGELQVLVSLLTSVIPWNDSGIVGV